MQKLFERKNNNQNRLAQQLSQQGGGALRAQVFHGVQ
jgi:hypothetical protein